MFGSNWHRSSVKVRKKKKAKVVLNSSLSAPKGAKMRAETSKCTGKSSNTQRTHCFSSLTEAALGANWCGSSIGSGLNTPLYAVLSSRLLLWLSMTTEIEIHNQIIILRSTS